MYIREQDEQEAIHKIIGTKTDSSRDSDRNSNSTLALPNYNTVDFGSVLTDTVCIENYRHAFQDERFGTQL